MEIRPETMSPARELLPSPSNSAAVAESLAPAFGEDDPRTRYLSFRASGFSVREAAQLVGVHQRTVKKWRHDHPEVADYERDISSIRQKFGAQFAYAEFLRNFRLVMIQDGKLLYKQAARPQELTPEDRAGLRQIRQYYTPQQMEIVRSALAGGKPGEGLGTSFNFTQVVMNLARADRDQPRAIQHGEQDE